MMIDIMDVYFVILTLVFSALFSGVEIAFITGNRLQMEIGKEKGVTGKIVSALANNPSMFIATMLVGNTLALSFYGIYMARIIEPILIQNLPQNLNGGAVIFFSQISISTIIVLITAEFLPKSLFLISPNKLFNAMALPIFIIYIAFYPFVFVIVGMSKFVITKILRLEFSNAKPAFGLTDLNTYVEQTLSEDEDTQHEFDAKILHNALEFKSVKVKECMVPRTEVVAIDIEDGLEELHKTFIETGFSKILVYKDSIDNMLGYCHSLNLFKKPDNIKEILSSLIIVPESMLANELLVQFIKNNKNVALVVDEFGGTSGIVTMEDVIEEILGDIQDEHDEEELLEEQINSHTYVFSARQEVDYLNEKYHFNLPEGEYETLGGLVLHIFQDIPQEGEIVETEKIDFEITQTQNNRIETIKVILK